MMVTPADSPGPELAPQVASPAGGAKSGPAPAGGVPDRAVNGQEQTTREITKPHAAEQEISIRFRISRAAHNRGRARGNLQSIRGP